jgi:hypothetical protein
VPDLGELALVARNEEHALVVAHVDGERDIHRREDDGVFERYQEQRGHVKLRNL